MALIAGQRIIGSGGKSIRVSIDVECSGLDLSKELPESIREAGSKAVDAIVDAVSFQELCNDPKMQESRKRQREDLITLFGDQVIFVEEVPNGYGSDFYYRFFPWYIVTTKIGHFRLGWRKRVIEIDWSRTLINTNGEDLFPGENVTKGGIHSKIPQIVHAWSYADAKKYIDKIFSLKAE